MNSRFVLQRLTDLWPGFSHQSIIITIMCRRACLLLRVLSPGASAASAPHQVVLLIVARLRSLLSMMRFRMSIVLARRLLLLEHGRVGRLLLRERGRVGRLLLASLVAVACNCCADSWCGLAGRLSITRVVTIEGYV